jgi:hypothetical protein
MLSLIFPSKFIFKAKRSVFQNIIFDWFFIIFPIWIGATYLILVNIFPVYRPFLFFSYLFIFGQSHFGATWLFFNNEGSNDWLIRNSFKLIFVPILLIVCFIIYSIYYLDSAIFLLSIVSTFHVTRQSIGIYKIYAIKTSSFEEYLIYSSTFFWIIIGFSRFFLLPQFEKNTNIEFIYFINIILFWISIVGVITFSLFALNSNRVHKNVLHSASLATGMLMFCPVAFVELPQDATIIGVSIHWCQYLALKFKLYFIDNGENNANFKNIKQSIINGFYIILYSLLMSIIITDYGTVFINLNYLIIIPLSFELYHFYIDAFIWRFSDAYIKEKIMEKLIYKNKM